MTSEIEVVSNVDPNDVLSAQDIIGIDDKQIVAVRIAAWGNKVVYLRTFTSGDRGALDADEFLAGRKYIEDKDNEAVVYQLKRYRERLIQKTLCDKDGNLLFTEADIGKLSAKNAKVMELLARKAQQLNGITDEDIKALAKNSPSSPNEDSSSN